MTLLELAKLLGKHLKLLVALPVICTLLTAAFAYGMLSDEYTASVSMYVLSTASTETVSSTDLSASQMITNDVASLIESNRVLGDAAESVGLDSLDGYEVSVSSSTSTRVITVSVTGSSARAVAIIANAIATTTDEVAQEIMGVEAVNIIDQATQPDDPSGPNRLLYVAVGFLAGLFLAVAIIVIVDMLNTRVRSSEEAEELLGVPVIGRIPAFKD